MSNVVVFSKKVADADHSYTGDTMYSVETQKGLIGFYVERNLGNGRSVYIIPSFVNGTSVDACLHDIDEVMASFFRVSPAMLVA